MRASILKFVKQLLLIWGGLSLVATIVLGIYVLFNFGVASRDKIDSASPRDVRYVLAGCHFDGKQIEQVVHSHISSRGLGGYMDAFAIKISPVDDADFTPKPDAPNEHWFRGNQLPPVLDAAVNLATQWHNTIPWFPAGAELRGSGVHVYPMDFYCCCGSVDPTRARLVFVRKADRMLFYFELKP